MDCRAAREILQNPSVASASEQRQAREHLAACRVCQTGLRHLAAQMTPSDPMCASVQEMLPLYMQDESAAKPVQGLYPRIWRHLQECRACARFHDELGTMLQMEREGRWITPPTYPAFSLPFLPSASPVSRTMAWTVEALHDAQGHLSTIITISKTYIMTMLFPQTPAWARSAKSVRAPTQSIPLMDSLVEEGPWLVSVELVREHEQMVGPEGWHLRVSLVSPAPPGAIQVRVTSDGEERTAVMDEHGQAFFRDVPLGWLSEDDAESVEGKLEIHLQQIPT